MATFNFNGVSSDTKNIVVVDESIFQIPQKKYKSANVYGRNGNSYFLEDAWEAVTVQYKILAGSSEEVEGETKTNYNTFDDIAEWLNSADGYAKLYDSFDPTHYRMAVCVDSANVTMGLEYYGKATITFRCRPERFIITEPIDVSNNDIINNPTNHVAEPIITLTGNGASCLLNIEKPIINGNYVHEYFIERFENYMGWGGLFEIDGELRVQMRDSSSASVTTNSNESGTLAFSTFNRLGFGTAVEVIPNTNYILSCNSNSASSVTIVFFSMNGNRPIINGIKKSISSAGQIVFPFTTPYECDRIAVYFERTDHASAQFTNIMLTTGTEVKTHVGYVEPSEQSIGIGDTSIVFEVSGFDTAIIDCEKENFTIDGENANIISTVQDQYENVSEKYLQLGKGNNVITFTSGIESVSIDSRFWEL